MTLAIERSLDELGRQRPEWQPWLTVVRAVVEEAADERWDRLVPDRAAPSDTKVPLLSGNRIEVDKNLIGRWTQRLMATAAGSGTANMATLELAAVDADLLSLFTAAVLQDGATLANTAARIGVDVDAFQAVASQLPIPFLHALNRRWSRLAPESWVEGYCPLCGAWPAFAEVRGVERSRHLRCGRCAGDWQLNELLCPYCGNDDHERLVRLVPEKGGTMRVVEACKRCLGYLKVFTTLQGSPPAKVVLDDLASVDLDVAALEQGYRRPPGPGYAVDVALVESRGG
ncbi:MAG TPA: formate dehydrogenase accessory protein FdhE [Verrucomicrobiae bacterium]|jgi:FdhE protein|nr:formate dehydrogenase accessory protein FdhE [Verrucomicrobiae bacterium]